MQSTIKSSPDPTYPILKIKPTVDFDMVILFTAPKTGMLVQVFNGEISLKN